MNKKEAVKRGLGRVRLTDDSMRRARVRKGDVVLVKLDAKPKQNKLCVAFTSWGELVVRRYYRKENGDVRLSTGQKGELFQVFAPGALIVLGPVVGVEKGGAR
jgi:SOS-response transcriptional repressor LexA